MTLVIVGLWVVLIEYAFFAVYGTGPGALWRLWWAFWAGIFGLMLIGLSRWERRKRFRRRDDEPRDLAPRDGGEAVSRRVLAG